MGTPGEHWHSQFNPSKFLSKVRFEDLKERNEAFNESLVQDSSSPCIFCRGLSPDGIRLSDGAFLCKSCYDEISLISYPEKYERADREFRITSRARELAEQEFRAKFEHTPNESGAVPLGWILLLCGFFHWGFAAAGISLIAFGYAVNHSERKKVERWKVLEKEWQARSPLPCPPELKHFHNPTAELSVRDHLILRVFNYWPGYPPFWNYLREVVKKRDGDRCQVTGCL